MPQAAPQTLSSGVLRPSALVGTAAGERQKESTASLEPPVNVVSSAFVEVLARLSLSDTPSPDPDNVTPPWSRPALLPIRSGEHRLTFQVTELLSHVDDNGDSVIQLFGLTEAGNSVMVAVYGFEHYFYYPEPSGFATSDLEPLRDYLNTCFKPNTVTRIERERSRAQHATTESPYLQILGKCEYREMFTTPEKTYEGNVPYTLRFMLDTRVMPMTWLRLSPRKYRIFKAETKVSQCQVEAAADWEDLQICDVVKGGPKVAPLRVLSFDLECDVPKHGFANPTHQPVFQIANMVSYVGTQAPFIRNVFTLKQCSPISGSQVSSYPTEKEMLLAWREFFLQVDPDIVIGYNITQFDINYLLKRAATLKIDSFPFLGRLKARPLVLPPAAPTFNTCPGFDGRLLVDMYFHIRDQYPDLPGRGAFKLNNVAWHFLQERKEDMEYSHIPILQNGTPNTRRELAIYCLKDAYLPLRLFHDLGTFEKEMDAAKSVVLPHGVLRTKPHWKRKTKKYLDAIEQGYLVMDVK